MVIGYKCACVTEFLPSALVDAVFHLNSVAESSTAHVAPPSAGADGSLKVALPEDGTRGHTLGVPGMVLDGLLYTGQELTDSFQLSQRGTEQGSFQLDSFTDSASGRCRGSGGLQGSVQGRHGLADLSQYSFSHESSTQADGRFPMEEEGEDPEEVRTRVVQCLLWSLVSNDVHCTCCAVSASGKEVITDFTTFEGCMC